MNRANAEIKAQPMTIGDTIRSSETRILAKIINFSATDVIVEVTTLPDSYAGGRSIGDLVTIQRRDNDHWKLNWRLETPK